jgi:hypothetical protein
MRNSLCFMGLIGLVCFCTFVSANEITLLNAECNGVSFEWKLSGYQVMTVGDYTVVDMPGASGLYRVGCPNLPSKQTFIEVPMDADLVLRICEQTIVTRKVDKPVVPAQEPPIDTVGEERLSLFFAKDAAAYTSAEPFPGNIVEVAYTGVMRGRRLALIRINPIQYVPKTGELRVYTHLVVNAEFRGATKQLGQTDAAMEPIAQGLVMNYVPAQRKSEGKVNFLIITVPEFETKANEYAKWKAEKGLITAVEIVGTNPAVSVVKDAIMKYYPDVAYVLILGGHNYIKLPLSAARHPLGDDRCRQLGLSDGTVPSDLYYACLEGVDYYPDIYIGRIPARNAIELDRLLGKIKTYAEQQDTSAWRNRFLLCGEFQYQTSKTNMAERLFCETAFTIWNSLKNQYTFPTRTIGTGSSGLGHATYFFRKAANPSDPTKPGTYRSKIRDTEEPIVDCQMPAEWTPNIVSDSVAKANVLAFWNEGCFLVQHRDHGGETLWGKPSLSKADVASLSNGDKQPVLFSVNCLTGAMDYSTDCFVEAALKNPNGGAAVAIGSTRISYSWWNDRLCDGFYTCMYGTGVYDCMDVGVKLPTNHPFSKKLGVILNFGKMYLALNYPSNPFGTSSDYTEIEFYLFHCIGDPEMDILDK